MSTSAIPLDNRQFRQVIAILDRERLSPTNERLFFWLNWSVWGTLIFSSMWLVVLYQYPDGQKYVLALALSSFIAAVLLFLGNLALVRKFWRAARTERRLGISVHVSALTATIMSRRPWRLWGLRVLTVIVLAPLGFLLVWFGGRALLAELWHFPPDIVRLPAPLGLFGFGLACLCLYPMNRSTQRLEAVAKLRATLREDKDLETTELNLLATLERTQILTARQQAVAASKAAGRRAGRVRFAPAFHESLSGLNQEEMARVYAALPMLLDRLKRDRRTPRSQIGRSFDVPNTSLAIAFTQDPSSGEVVVEALRGA